MKKNIINISTKNAEHSLNPQPIFFIFHQLPDFSANFRLAIFFQGNFFLGGGGGKEAKFDK